MCTRLYGLNAAPTRQQLQKLVQDMLSDKENADKATVEAETAATEAKAKEEDARRTTEQSSH